jgi:hypothetical protein
MRRKGLLHSEAMVYEADYDDEVNFLTLPPTTRRRRCVRGSCSCCGAAFHAQYREGQMGCCGQREQFGFYHPETGRSEKNYGESTCPLCGAEVKVYHCGSVRDYGHTLEAHRPVTVHVVDGLPMIIQWEVRRTVEWRNKHAVTANEVWPHEAYVYTGKATVKLVGYRWHMYNYSRTKTWEQRAKCTDGVACPELRMDFDPEHMTFSYHLHDMDQMRSEGRAARAVQRTNKKKLGQLEELPEEGQEELPF